MAAPAIQLDHVTFQYDSQAEPTLHDINLTIQPGEKVLIVRAIPGQANPH